MFLFWAIISREMIFVSGMIFPGKAKCPDRPQSAGDLFWRECVGIEPTYAATNYNYWF